MSGFKPGDKVTPLNVYRQDYAGPMERLIGKTMTVVSISKDREGNEIVHADVPGETELAWYAQDLRLVSETQADPIDPEQKAAQKPIRRGDLVEYDGVLWVVYSDGEDICGQYRIASLTGEPIIHYAALAELIFAGSIHKKIKKVKRERKL